MALTELSSVTVILRGEARPPQHEADRTVICLRGEHDAFTMVELADAMARVIAFDEGDLVVDLSEVEFMGVATVGALLRAQRLLRTRSRSMVLRSPSACARRVLDLCGPELLDSSLADATPLAGPRGALGTWVAVPASDRVDRSAAAPPEPSPAHLTAEPGATNMADCTGP